MASFCLCTVWQRFVGSLGHHRGHHATLVGRAGLPCSAPFGHSQDDGHGRKLCVAIAGVGVLSPVWNYFAPGFVL